MLFLQGTRDALADLALMQETHARIAERATLEIVEGADHSFHVLKRSGRSDGEVLDRLAETIAGWTLALPARARS
jgi:predicted alpha/beta-hydrolase family hydrolase